MHVCMQVCVCMHVCMHAYMYIFECVCVRACMCVCVCVHVRSIILILFYYWCHSVVFFLGFFCCQEKLSKSINPKQFMTIHFVVHMVCFLVTLGSSATIKSNLSNRSQLHRAAKSNPMTFIERV